jgi:hypothetical protein
MVTMGTALTLTVGTAPTVTAGTPALVTAGSGALTKPRPVTVAPVVLVAAFAMGMLPMVAAIGVVVVVVMLAGVPKTVSTPPRKLLKLRLKKLVTVFNGITLAVVTVGVLELAGLLLLTVVGVMLVVLKTVRPWLIPP